VAPTAFVYVRLSRDGLHVATTVISPLRASLWLLDVKRSVWTECRECGPALSKAWSHDGQRLLVGNGDSIVEHAIEGGTRDRVVFREPHRLLSPAQSLADGRIIYVSQRDDEVTVGAVSPDMSEIKLWSQGESTRTIVSGRVARSPEVSPDGRWLAFSAMSAPPSGEAPSSDQVFVQSFPREGTTIQISQDGGTNPAWSPDGKSLYFVKLNVGMFAVEFAGDGAALRPGTPRLLFRADGSRLAACLPVRCFDVPHDGSRFLNLQPNTATNTESVARIDLLHNWTSTLPK
jgi:serine/threonine-protein kinase